MLNGSFWVGQNKIMTSWLKIIILLTFFCLILVEKIFHNIKIWLKVRGCCARLFPGIIKSLVDIIVVHQVIVPVTDLCEKNNFSFSVYRTYNHHSGICHFFVNPSGPLQKRGNSYAAPSQTFNKPQVQWNTFWNLLQEPLW